MKLRDELIVFFKDDSNVAEIKKFLDDIGLFILNISLWNLKILIVKPKEAEKGPELLQKLNSKENKDLVLSASFNYERQTYIK